MPNPRMTGGKSGSDPDFPGNILLQFFEVFGRM